jgi:hypothetical protein
MTHARCAVAAIVASVTIAVGLPEVIKHWRTSAHAQTQTAPPESTIWDHNGSVMDPRAVIAATRRDDIVAHFNRPQLH